MVRILVADSLLLPSAATMASAPLDCICFRRSQPGLHTPRSRFTLSLAVQACTCGRYSLPVSLRTALLTALAAKPFQIQDLDLNGSSSDDTTGALSGVGQSADERFAMVPRMSGGRQAVQCFHVNVKQEFALPKLPRRSFVTDIAYRIVGRVAQIEIIPNASDYRLLDRHALDAIRSLPESGRLYRGLTPWVGFRQCVIPYTAAERAAGKSQYGLKQLLNLFARALFDFSSLPLHLGLVLGGIAIVFSALYLIFIVAWLLVGEAAPPGWASGDSVTLMLNSVSLAFSGIIGVYVARIYNEVRARPAYMLSRIRKHVDRVEYDEASK